MLGAASRRVAADSASPKITQVYLGQIVAHFSPIEVVGNKHVIQLP
jgi:hypothetical protein